MAIGMLLLLLPVVALTVPMVAAAVGDAPFVPVGASDDSVCMQPSTLPLWMAVIPRRFKQALGRRSCSLDLVLGCSCRERADGIVCPASSELGTVLFATSAIASSVRFRPLSLSVSRLWQAWMCTARW
ncbi:hypothetical protein BC831DRAFT_440914 [Entophlyctis helioformis]|nr:hypothetical protein BC831DRAFT_440914 [Entophlyctis helioformis]